MKMEDKPAITKPRKAFASIQFYYDDDRVPMVDITHNEIDHMGVFSNLQAMVLARKVAYDIKGTKAEHFLQTFCEYLSERLANNKGGL